MRMGLSISVATGLYGVSFGALSVAAGLNVLQTVALSLLMFTGGSQFAFIGVIAGGVCYWACTSLKHRFHYDDSLDVFGVHGIGGLIGTLLAGVFAVHSIGGASGLLDGNPQQLLLQVYGVAVTLLWTVAVTFVLLKVVGGFVPLRVTRDHELEGLDLTQHGEALQ